MNARHASSTLSNRIPFSCSFTSGNMKKSEGGRSDEYGVDAAAAAPPPRSHQERQLLLLLCANWHCHNKEKGHRVLSLGVVGTKPRRPSEDMMKALVRIECPSVLKRKGGDLARFSEETGNHFLLRNSQTADCISVSGPYRRIQVSSPVSTSQVNF